MTVARIPQVSLSVLFLALAAASCTESSVGPAKLSLTFGATAGYPASSLRIRGGPPGELAVDGRFTDTVSLAPATLWPMTYTIIGPAGDTLGRANIEINLISGQLTEVGSAVLTTSVGVWICPPILAKAPVAVAGREPDTLFVVSWGPAPEGTQFPVC